MTIRPQQQFYFMAILFLLLIPAGGAMQVRLSGDLIYDTGSSHKTLAPELRHTLKSIDSVTSLFCRNITRKEGYLCRLYSIPHWQQKSLKLERHKNEYYLTLPDSYDVVKDRQLQLDLLQILVLLKLKIAPEQHYRQFPQWLSAALWSKLKRKLNKQPIVGPKVFPAARSLTISGKVPAISTLVTAPLLNEDGPAFDFYAECCELLLNFVLTYKTALNDSFKTYITASINQPQDNYMDFNLLILSAIEAKRAKTAQPGQQAVSIQRIFNEYFTSRTINYFSPGNSVYAKKALARTLQEISYLVKQKEKPLPKPSPPSPTTASGAPAKPSFAQEQPPAELPSQPPAPAQAKQPVNSNTITIKAENSELTLDVERTSVKALPTVWHKVFNKTDIIRSLKNRFNRMRYSLPAVYGEAFDQFNEAIDELKADDPEDFLEELAEGEKIFHSCYWKQKRLEMYLQSVEEHYVPPGKRYHYLQQAEDLIRKRHKQVHQELHQYLDEVEKRYNSE